MWKCLYLLWCLSSVAHAAAIDSSKLPGEWQGSGRYYETAITESVAFHLQIDATLRLSGQVGGAEIQAAAPRVQADQIQYQLSLVGEVSPNARLRAKDHLVLLITQVEGERFAADFHLKSWHGFDPSMHPGELLAERKPAPR